MEHFFPGTTVNGEGADLLTVREANSLILAQAEGYIRRLGEEWSIPELARLLAEGGLPSYEGYAPAWLRRLLVDYAHREEKIYGAFLRQLAKGPDPGLEYRLRERAAQDNLDLRLLSFMYILDS